MTLSSATNRNDYTGNGTADTFAYSFKIFNQSELVVTVADSDGTETTLTITTDYTVTGAGETSGGNVVLVNASQAWLDGDGDLDTGYTLTIRRIVPLTQETDIRNQGDFFPEAHENAFDKMTMISQQQQDELDRSLKIPITDTTTNPDMPVSVADGYIGWNSDGTAIVSKTPTSLSDSGPNINSGDAGKIVNVNSGETAYQLSTFKALLEAITSGGLTVNTALTAASTLGVTGAATFSNTIAANAALTMGSIFRFAKGVDVASTGSMSLGEDGNIFDITGTTNITSITAKTAGTVVILQFDGVLTLTDGSNLKLNGNFLTAAESVIILYCDGTNWFEIARSGKLGTLEFGSGVAVTSILDEDTMSSDSASALATQQSIKAYRDSLLIDEDNFSSDTATQCPSQQSTKAYIATQIKSLGTWANATITTATQVTDDSFILGYFEESGDFDYDIKTDSSNPPTTIRQRCDSKANSMGIAFCVPVKANDYYQITPNSAATTAVAFVIPLS